MIDNLFHSLKDIPQEIVVMITAALPISELRGAIPVGLSFGMSWQKVFWLSIIGNAIPVIPVLFLLKPVSGWLSQFWIFKRFFDWYFEQTKKKSDIIQKWEVLGLAVFVGIPLPMTGAWSGAIAASLLKMKFRYAFLGIVLGIFIAGIIVSILCYLGITSWKVFIK